ncbi:helix-turn-helix transcriptional regulator [Bordetella genomosp. 5]|uniref:helix-turn-helix transcriptional regulator n=1 Tax=Bordetella genomosp. 5 TaxID=1395608 RepID=UPI000B9EEA01|nr:response regulator transcription factor [Bordetella genomosp. 5]OZI39809.1 helix-turn-helix transcriptional regulator [Bordetella genomosp. 5]
MSTVLIEDYALLRVAIQHVLRDAGLGEDLASGELSQLEALRNTSVHPVELLLFGGSTHADHDVTALASVLDVLAPRRVLVLYAEFEAALMAAAVRAGAAGYVSKSLSPAALSAAVRLVLAGGECYPMPTRRAPARRPSAPPDAPTRLTQRQEEILRLMVRGKTMREISREVGTSVATVKSHARTLYWKLNARNQAAAAFTAVNLGLVPGLDDDQDDDSSP